MKKRELKELRGGSMEELNKKLSELQTKKVELAAKVASGKEKNLRATKNIRRDIAQILSILYEKGSRAKK